MVMTPGMIKGRWLDDFNAAGDIRPARVSIGLPPLVSSLENVYHFMITRRAYPHAAHYAKNKCGNKKGHVKSLVADEIMNTFGRGIKVPPTILS